MTGRKVDGVLWDLVVPPITPQEARVLGNGLLLEIHDERRRLGLSQRCLADLLGISQSAVADGERNLNDSRLSLVCGLAYAVRKRLVLVPWDDTSS